VTKLAIVGASGRMGMRLVALAPEHACTVVAGITRASSQLSGTPDVIIDFSVPSATRHWLGVARERRIPMLIGTTGLSPEDHKAIDAAAADAAVLQAPNMSLGVAAMYELARRAAQLLGDACDIAIVESHHRGKKDAPSGTALALRDAIGRDGVQIQSLRMGDEVGRHTAYFALAGERIELTHVATNRDTFAHGALRAAIWLARQRSGRYTIADVFTERSR
jgi:4-hydroxy-tetrahydrodipicolinate reductase